MGKRKLAVVLSGGGAKGAYEAGALSTIVKHVKRIDVLTGASIGAINAALFAWEYEKNGDMVKAAEIVKDMWYELDKLFRISSWRLLKEMLLSFVKTCSPFNFASLVDNSIIKDRLNSLFPEDLKISDITNLELVINATSLTAGKAVSFNRDSGVTIIEALLASSAIPLLFPAQILEGSYYVDGGLFNNTPLRDAINARATDIIVVELKPPTSEIYWDTIGDSTRYDSIYNTGSRLMEV